MEKIVFTLKDVHYSYPGKIPALCGINLEIREGSKVVIIGANGSGKSTLLTMLDALLFPDKGNIEAFGRELKESLFGDVDFSRFFRSNVGFVFQNPDVQLFCPTVKEDIIFGPLQLGVPLDEVARRLEEFTGILGIWHLLDRTPHQLSIGEKRKVAIASVLAIQPEVLLLDEPTAGLDPQTTRDIVDIILNEHLSAKTIVTVTHDLHIMQELADTVYVLGAKRNIIRSASPSDILSDQDFLQRNNLAHIHRHRHIEAAHTHPHLHAGHPLP
jgi:cobalt/nickel transport system ATP-binding protein